MFRDASAEATHGAQPESPGAENVAERESHEVKDAVQSVTPPVTADTADTSATPATAAPTNLGRALTIAVIALAIAGAGPVLANLLLGTPLYESLHRSFPGYPTALIAAALRGAADLAGVVALGAVVSVLFLHPRNSRNAESLRMAPDLRLLTWTAGTWTVLAAANAIVSAADANGQPLARLTEPGAFGSLFMYGYMPRAWAFTAVGALILWLCAHWGTKWSTLLLGLWSSSLAILAPVVVGQVLVGPNHDIGSDAGIIQTLTVGLCLGPVLVAGFLHAVHRGSAPTVPLDTRRIMQVAVVGGVIVLITQAILTWFTLAGSGLFESITGVLLIARFVLILAVVAAAILALKQGRTAPRTARVREPKSASETSSAASLKTGSGPDTTPAAVTGTVRRPSLFVAAAALVVWIAIGAAMTRIPPPHYFVPTSIPEVIMGFDTPEPPTLPRLFTQWRINLLFLVMSVAGIVGYLAMVRVIKRRGIPWPIARTILWCTGWLTVLFATNSGFGKYSAPDFGVHMAVHMCLSMLGPILLVQGGVVTLVLRTFRANRSRAGVHLWLTQALHWKVARFIYHPALVFVLFIASYYGLYFTPLFETLMRFHYAHQAMNLHFLIVGYLYYSLIVGVDRPPRSLPHIGKLGYTFAAMPFHAFFGVAIISSSTLIAENYYRTLDMPWADLWHTQQVAGSIAWAGGELPLLVAMVALCIQWARQDSKEAARKDRHLDRGLDAEFDAYNDMLKKLAEREHS